MTNEERLQEYIVCCRRGHKPVTVRITLGDVDASWSVCEYCGTHYKYEKKLIERNRPEE